MGQKNHAKSRDTSLGRLIEEGVKSDMDSKTTDESAETDPRAALAGGNVAGQSADTKPMDDMAGDDGAGHNHPDSSTALDHRNIMEDATDEAHSSDEEVPIH